nr:guanine nucleotide-binding protein-like 1 [Onthophagus taurus]
MPQGRRKIPFSGKAKKEQLKAKKQGKHPQSQDHRGTNRKKVLLMDRSDDEENGSEAVQKVNYQPTRGKQGNRYILQFYKEADEEIKRRKELARHSLEYISEDKLEINGDEYFPKDLDFPKRPLWSYDMSREEVEMREQRYFMEYLNHLEKKFSWKDLSYFELNLETWRQLWRVLEMSDIILFIIDIRFPALMFPPSLYDYTTNVLKKDMILVMNKIDLSPAPLVAAWKNYFKEKYPNLHILMFTSLPGYNLIGNQSNKSGLQVRRRKGKLKMASEGAQLLLDICKDIVKEQVDLASWQNKIKEEMSMEYDENEAVQIEESISIKKIDTGFYQHNKYIDGVLTIGCIGQPNVGKSSVMNALMGKKVVSVSRTPGHTKHFQTIFLTRNVRLCDCPGLVFPSKVPKVCQVLMGSFPIAQLREPYTTIKYLAERIDLPKLLKIDHPDGDDSWSAMDICDGWAKKRGLITAKAARLDSYRAANSILRMALDGKLCLSLTPPHYTERKDFWLNHSDVEIVKWIQAKGGSDMENIENIPPEDLSDDDDGDELHSAACGGPDESSESTCEEEISDTEDVVASTNKFAALSDA